MLRLLGAFRYAQPILGSLRLRRITRCYPLPASMRDRSAPQNGLSAAKQRATRRRTAPGMAHPEHALGAAHRSNIREWYCDHAPRPNTWPLNIEPLGRFRPQRDFL